MLNRLQYIFILCVFFGLRGYSQLASLYSFSGNAPVGKFPTGNLISDGTYLYGTCSYGGSPGLGTIFRILPNGTGHTTLHSFGTGSDGRYPFGSLISVGSYHYGMTAAGGAYNSGTIFKIMPNGTGYDTIYSFNFTDGSAPLGALVYDGTYFYGMTSSGGINGYGVIFKILPNGTGFTKLLDFSGSTNGKYPQGSLYLDGGMLYGMTKQGGANDDGCIFKISTNGTGFVKIFDFAQLTSGEWPHGTLISDGTYLYGMVSQGGSGGAGVAFKIMPDGSGFTSIVDFTGTANGGFPERDLTFDGTYLYGLTTTGGAANYGVLFRVLPNGTGFAKLADFNGLGNGKAPRSTLLFAAGSFYGTTHYGGSYDNGTIFKYDSVTGLVEYSEDNSFSAWPSPSTGIFHVHSQTEIGTISVFNSIGDIVFYSQFSQSDFELNLSNQAEGVYFIIVNPADQVKEINIPNQRVVIVK